jgi:hypothetical protein
MSGVLGIMMMNQTVAQVSATGGQTIYDGTGTLAGYRFHVFTANGNFTVTSNLGNKTFDAVLVGGGGAAGSFTAQLPGGGGGGGGAVVDVTGAIVITNTPYAVVVGSAGTTGPGGPIPQPIILYPGGASTWNGFTAAGGIRANGPSLGGASGNGNPGSTTPSSIGGGGGGAGGPGLTGTPGNPVGNIPAPGEPQVPFWLNGGGGPGYTSTIDGKPYGGGGGGGPNFGPAPVYNANPNFANAYTPTATTFNPVSYSVIYGSEFVPGGGGLARSPGVNGKGGGAGGQMGGPPGYNNQIYPGGSGTVVIRYPYITAPGEPTNVTAVVGNGQSTVSFTAPVADGGSAIIDYTVTSSPGNITATGSGSPITITGLTNGTTYKFTVKARNSVGSSLASADSNAVIPDASPVQNLVIATGGQTIYDGTGAYSGYRFHVFTANGTFNIASNLQNKTFDVIIVGGGGGSGAPGAISGGRGGGGGGAVLEVPTLTLSSNTDYAVVVGAGAADEPGVPQPAMRPAGHKSIFYGYNAAGGSRNAPAAGGTSGNGNVGGVGSPSPLGNSVAGGGGGAGAAGNNGRAWTNPPSPTAPPGLPIGPVYVSAFAGANYPTPYETYWRTGSWAGGGGSGYTSSIDGKSYGAGGAGGAIKDGAGAVPSAAWNGKYTPETDPTGTSFIPGGGGAFMTPGVTGTGGGSGGTSGGPPQYSADNFLNGGSGTVVIRYPYP